MKKGWPLTATLLKDKLSCRSEYLYVKEPTYVKQNEMKKGWPLTATLLEDNFFWSKSALICAISQL
jgi:hypothetical protein